MSDGSTPSYDLQRIARHVFEFGQRLDARVAATDEDERESALAHGDVSVDAAMSSFDNTWLRKKIASPTVLKPMPFSASPGIGNVRATEPGATTMMS